MEEPKDGTHCTVTTAGGISADYAEHFDVTCAVSPAHESDKKLCTLQPPIRPVACWRIDDMRFDFDSSFVLPGGAHEFALLAQRRPPEPGTAPATGPLLTVFGHADPSGSDSYNKPLSGRRAAAVYGILVRDVDLWDQLYLKGSGNDDWGYRHIQIMLDTLGYSPGATNGSSTAASTTAVREFQSTHLSVTGAKLPQTGQVDADTRKALFAAYMDALCIDQSGIPFRYRKEEFISREPKGLKDGKLDYQGCSEFNPILVFSKAEEKDYQKSSRKAARDADNRPNRRVVVYMFPNAMKFTESSWPCPVSSADGAQCHQHFWPNGEQRRSPQELRREHLHGGRTFACQFYDRIARGSPCEGLRTDVRLFLYDRDGKLSGNAPYRLEVGGEIREGFTSSEGCLREPGIIGNRKAIVEWTPGHLIAEGTRPTYHTEFAEVNLNTTDADADTKRIDRELRNLGYLKEDREQNRKIFSEEFGATVPNSDDGIHEAHCSGTPKQCRVPIHR